MINIQHIDVSEHFKWGLVRYLNPADHNARRNRKGRDFKDIKAPVKIRDIHKIENKISTSITVFNYGNKGMNENIQSMY